MRRLHESIFAFFYFIFVVNIYLTHRIIQTRERERGETEKYYFNYSSINRTLIILKYKLNNAS